MQSLYCKELPIINEGPNHGMTAPCCPLYVQILHLFVRSRNVAAACNHLDDGLGHDMEFKRPAPLTDVLHVECQSLVP